ncbi:MAG: hypothetical protein OHK0015_21980 [Chloroflexi bacterium OHK40]
MNLNQKQARYAGIGLIVLGVIAIFNLWWLIPAALLAGGGVAIYQRQRALGRRGEAVQALLWGIGLAVLLLLDFVFPGVLLLGGASLLLRGREGQADDRVQAAVARFGRRRTPAMPASQAPVAQPQPPATVVSTDPGASETVRLR